MAPARKTTSRSEGPQLPAAPSISLPKGGGAIRGIDEKFAANPATGSGSITIPIALSPGRSGFGPQLALSYDSGSGNSAFGFGWNLALPSITRRTDKGLPQYDEESDIFILSGAEDLTPSPAEGPDLAPAGYRVQRYRPRIEGLFARIERWTRRSDGDIHWRSISQENVLTIYGKDENSRIADPGDPQRIFTWLICETRDDKGNAVLYEYKAEDGAGVDMSQAHERNRGDRDDLRRSANRYLKRIRYGNRVPLLDNAGQRPGLLTNGQIQNAGWMFEVVFDYGEHDDNVPKPHDSGQWIYRDDPLSSYRAGFEVRTGRLCRRVLMFHHFDSEAGVGDDCLVRSTDFTYSHQQDPGDVRNAVYTFLRVVTQSGYRRHNGGYLKRSLPPVEFEYTQPIIQDTIQDVDAASLENLPIGLDGAAYQWTDLHGEGIPGILTEQAGAWFYKRNVSPISDRPVEFAPLERVATRPNLDLAAGQAQFMDLAGDGQLDLVVLDGPTPGLYEHDGAEDWQPFRPFTSHLNRDTRDPNLRFVDLDGDGHADVLISEDDAFTWHASLAEDGFGPARRVQQALDEEHGPRLVFANGAQSIYLADLSGDGLTDLVRIRNGEICYWPNLGYGRFGTKVTMDNAPHFDHPDQFDHKRIRLADIDGTGTTDIMYVHHDGVRLYFNQSGNSWSAPYPLHVSPNVDDLIAITLADLFGNGTACLIWSSPLPGDARRQVRYVDLMGGQKPHLLVKTINNLGAETCIAYAPSTKFYLQDRRDGKPWITRLPFPVHVVERVEIYDQISRNRFVTRYAYHHGYFDGQEREFRGFGMVEQFDTEEFGTLSTSDGFPTSDNIDAASHVPPVHTKTWFHTGIYLDRSRVSNFYAGLLDERDQGEYYREPGLTDAQARDLLLDDSVLPDGLTVEEEREACRALKGAMLRQEVYALDGSGKAAHPYAVTEQNFTIRMLQRCDDNRHGVFFVHPRESISYHYERNPDDPRTGHTLTLEADEFGNILKSAMIGYGRRRPDLSLPADDQARQQQTFVTYTENRVTNAVASADAYRAPLPCETRAYELTGYLPSGSVGRFQSADLVQQTDGGAALIFDSEIAYEDAPAGGRQRRLIEHIRVRYRPDDLGAAQADPLVLLPLGQAESLALPGESYKLAFTPGLLAQVFLRPHDAVQPPGSPAAEILLPDPAAVLGGRGTEGGGYVDLDGDGRWWIPAGRAFLSPGGSDAPAQELAHARGHFFLPHRYRDPFHTDQHNTEMIVAYDDPRLLVVETRDALGNTTRAQNDYRVLAPRLATDSNGNRSEATFDALGMVAATAVRGKDGQNLGDLLEDIDADPPLAALQAFAADPHGQAANLLGKATARIVYDLGRYQRSGQPALAATLTRETHFADPGGAQTNIKVGFTYSDGFGREIQQKIPAEPGAAPQREPAQTLPSGDVRPGALVRDADGKPVLADTPQRWVGSGRTVFNNKGKPVRQYEPFFAATHLYEDEREMTDTGVSPILFYDPVERVVATLRPDHSWEKVVFDPWRQAVYDVNDTVLRDPAADDDVKGFFTRLPDAEYLPTWHAARQNGQLGPAEQAAAEKAAVHADTPVVAHADSLGRSFLTVAHNRFKRSDAPACDPPAEEFHHTRVYFDIEGNQRAFIDALGRVVMRYDYDMLGSAIHQASMDAGERWTIDDAAGQPFYGWDSQGRRFRTAYDALRRPTDAFVREGAGAELRVGRTIYGETYPNPEAGNLRGKTVQLFDQAGVVTANEYDFKGNLLSRSRQFAQEYKATLDWPAVALEAEVYASGTRYDALNRPTELTAPHTLDMQPSVIRLGYNAASLLERVEASLHGAQPAAVFVANIDYDAKGQRTRISYSNGVATTYEYNPLTFRLARLRTQRGAERLQDLSYAYDPAGNIASIRDDAQQTIYFNGQVVEPHAAYVYDALYRLISASGREHIGQLGQPETTWDDAFRMRLQHPNDGQAMRNYAEQYLYDAVGNFAQLVHRAAGGDWTRAYAYAEPSLIEPGRASNRLSSTTIGQATESYAYDAHGNLTHMSHLPLMRWNERDQLQATARQIVSNGGAPETTYYVYEAGGQRTRKVTERQAAAGQTPTRKSERIYLGGFEIYREYGNDGSTVTLERETLHIMDDKRRIALVETRTDTPAPEQLIRYQLGNHLDSASLELDEAGQIISYEEYYPYGSTSYQAGRSAAEVGLKRYRYTAMERDEESGFSYHGARYYAPWLGRWLNCDPLGIKAGLNLYAYSNTNPVVFNDQNGAEPKKTDPEWLQYLDAWVTGTPYHNLTVSGKRGELLNAGAHRTISEAVINPGKRNPNTFDYWRIHYQNTGTVPPRLTCDQVVWMTHVARGVGAPGGNAELLEWYAKQNALKRLDSLDQVKDIKPGATIFFVEKGSPRQRTEELNLGGSLAPRTKFYTIYINDPVGKSRRVSIPIEYRIFHSAIVTKASKDSVETYETGSELVGNQSFAGRKTRDPKSFVGGNWVVYYGYVSDGTSPKWRDTWLQDYYDNAADVEEQRTTRVKATKPDMSRIGDFPLSTGGEQDTGSALPPQIGPQPSDRREIERLPINRSVAGGV
jgi:RHS repeat-associated protein